MKMNLDTMNEMILKWRSHYLVFNPCPVTAQQRCSLLRGHTSSVCCLLVNWELRLVNLRAMQLCSQFTGAMGQYSNYEHGNIWQSYGNHESWTNGQCRRVQASHERWIDGRPSLVDFGVTAIR